MFEKLLIAITELFKASGSFWALYIAHQLFLSGLQNGGGYLFLFPVALFLVGISFFVIVDCVINVYQVFLIETNPNDDEKS